MPSKRKRTLPMLLVVMLTSEEVIDGIIKQVRREFHLREPSSRADVTANLVHPREPILARVEQLCMQMEWQGDLDWLRPAFHPSDVAHEMEPDPKEIADLPPLAGAFAAIFFEILPKAFQQAGYGAIRYRVITWLTDYALEGNFAEIKPLPAMFDTHVLQLPFFEDTVLVGLVTRFSDFDAMVKQLDAKRRELFVPRTRHRDPDNIERNLWAISQYQEIDKELFEGHVYDELLRRFTASRWADQVTKHDLNSYDGCERAKAFLRKVIATARKQAKTMLPDAPHEKQSPRDA